MYCIVEPLTGRRLTHATPRRGYREFAHALTRIARRYHRAKFIHLVVDNLSVHCEKACIVTYGWRRWRRFRVHFTPKHGSWLMPCAGYVTTTTAALVGTVSGIVCYLAVNLKNRLKWDDALDVWGVHGVGGILGTNALGVFATTAVNPAGADGLLAGNVAFFGKQVIAVLGASAATFGFTYGMLYVMNKVTPVRVSEESEVIGLDTALHSEQAYELEAVAERKAS